jgi:hypothetical protein
MRRVKIDGVLVEYELTGVGEPERLEGFHVSRELFPMLGAVASMFD